jgi:hypothetical protein
MKNVVSFVVGLVFAIGLGVGGMTDPQIVKAFLDVTGDWNPQLVGVMIGAIGVHAIVYQLVRRRGSPLLEAKFHLPTRQDLDVRLILGAALFGVGWGLAGICPGPGIVSLLSFKKPIMLFVGSMLVGMAIFNWLETKKFI